MPQPGSTRAGYSVAAVFAGAVLTLDEAVDLGRELWGKLQDERII